MSGQGNLIPSVDSTSAVKHRSLLVNHAEDSMLVVVGGGDKYTQKVIIPYRQNTSSTVSGYGGHKRSSQQSIRSNSRDRAGKEVINCQTFIDIIHKHIQALPV